MKKFMGHIDILSRGRGAAPVEKFPGVHPADLYPTGEGYLPSDYRKRGLKYARSFVNGDKAYDNAVAMLNELGLYFSAPCRGVICDASYYIDLWIQDDVGILVNGEGHLMFEVGEVVALTRFTSGQIREKLEEKYGPAKKPGLMLHGNV